MRGAGTAQDVVELVGARGTNNVGDVDMGTLTMWYYSNNNGAWRNYLFLTPISGIAVGNKNKSQNVKYPFTSSNFTDSYIDKAIYYAPSNNYIYIRDTDYSTAAAFKTAMSGVHLFYELASPVSFSDLFLSASSTSDELTAMPADAIPLSEIQFADNNWSIEEAIYDAPEADANGVITPTAVTGQMRIQYSLDAAEQILTLQTEYDALEARVTALENA